MEKSPIMPHSLCCFISIIEIKACSNWYLCSQSYLHPCTWGQLNIFVFHLMELPQTRTYTTDIQVLFVGFNNVIPTDVLLLILKSKQSSCLWKLGLPPTRGDPIVSCIELSLNIFVRGTPPILINPYLSFQNIFHPSLLLLFCNSQQDSWKY